MKLITYINQRTKEKYLCENPRDFQWIDGVKFIKVRKPNEHREFLIRQDTLERITA